MFWDFLEYPSVLEIYDYNSVEELRASFEQKIIIPAEGKVEDLLEKRLLLQEEKLKRREGGLKR